ncbi:MAG: methyltransferase domain-containing protein [Piscinibacter sp.]|nr:methyltransferase domain-containing protein [Piscinibacter sp.]
MTPPGAPAALPPEGGAAGGPAEPDPRRPLDRVGWRDRWYAWRDRRLVDPGFRTWAERFALTRPIARRRAAQLFDLVAGFVYSQVLAACVRLDLFALLANGPLTLECIAARVSLPLEGARRLLDAAVAVRLLERRGGERYGLGPLGAPLVDNPGLVAMIEHHATLYRDLADPLALLRGGRSDGALAQYWPYATAAERRGLDAAPLARYSGLMSASLPLVAEQVLDAYPVARHRCLLDIGGGEGGFLCAAARRAPGLRLMLADLPGVAARAAERFAREGLAGRAEVFGLDFHADALPRGADLVSLVRVVHDHDDAPVRALLRAAHAALEPGGTLLLAEPMAGTGGAQAMGDAYFGLYLLAMGSGRPRRADELATLLRAAGFAAVRRLPTRMPLQCGLLIACKPARPSGVNNA